MTDSLKTRDTKEFVSPGKAYTNPPPPVTVASGTAPANAGCVKKDRGRYSYTTTHRGRY